MMIDRTRQDLLNLRAEIERIQRRSTPQDTVRHLYHNVLVNNRLCTSLMTYDTDYIIKTYRRITEDNYVIYIIDDITSKKQKITVYNRNRAKAITRTYSTNYTVAHDGYTLKTDKTNYNRIKATQEHTRITQLKRLTERTYSINPIYDKAYNILAQACATINNADYMTISDCDVLARAITKRIASFAKIELAMVINTIIDYMSTHKHGTIKICRKIMGFKIQTLEKNHRDIDNQLRLWEIMSDKINKNDRRAKSEISALSLDSLVNDGYEPASDNIGCLGVTDLRLLDMLHYVHLHGDDIRYSGCNISTAQESRFLKKYMQKMLDTLGFKEANASAKNYIELCNLAYLKYTA